MCHRDPGAFIPVAVSKGTSFALLMRGVWVPFPARLLLRSRVKSGDAGD